MATLIATLGLDSSQYNRSFDDATEKVVQWARAFGIIISAGTVAQFTREAIRLANAVDQMAQKTGLSTSEVQRLAFVIEQNKGSLRDFETSLVQLGIRAQNNAESFDKWGISVNKIDGAMKSNLELFLEVSDAIRDASTQGERMAIANATMGRTGTNLIPVLQMGSEEMLRVAASAKIMREDTVESINAMNDAWDAMKLETVVTLANVIGDISNGNFGGAIAEAFGLLDTVIAKLMQGVVGLFGSITVGVHQGVVTLLGMLSSGIGGIMDMVPGSGGRFSAASANINEGMQAGVEGHAEGWLRLFDQTGEGFQIADRIRASRGEEHIIDPRTATAMVVPTPEIATPQEPAVAMAARAEEAMSASRQRIQEVLAERQPQTRAELRSAAREVAERMPVFDRRQASDDLWAMSTNINAMGSRIYDLRIQADHLMHGPERAKIEAERDQLIQQRNQESAKFDAAQREAQRQSAIAASIANWSPVAQQLALMDPSARAAAFARMSPQQQATIQAAMNMQAQSAVAQVALAPGQQVQTGAGAAGGTGNLTVDISTLVTLATRRNALLEGRYKAQ